MPHSLRQDPAKGHFRLRNKTKQTEKKTLQGEDLSQAESGIQVREQEGGLVKLRQPRL